MEERKPAAPDMPALSSSDASTAAEGPGGAPLDRPSSSPAVLERIGVYRVEARIGRGGMGEVFLAWDDRLERYVALKRIRRDAGMTPGQRERLRREARAVASLNHPAIVQVHDFVEHESGDCIVMEYVQGRTLAALLAEGPREAAFAVRLGRQIAEGLAQAHAAGLIHRDLKAENIVVTASGQAKILDFGLVKPVLPDADEDRLTEHGALLGTYHAMSPEQAGGGDLDERSDLFSLGVLLYEMLTGRSPFRGANPLDTLRRVLTEQPPSLAESRPDLPGELAGLVDRLLAKDREARPRTAQEVARTLAGIEGTRELESGTGSPPPTVWPAGERMSEVPTGTTWPAAAAPRAGRRLWIAAGAAAALLSAGAAYFLGRPPAEPLRVVVPEPAVNAATDERLSLAASGVLAAALETLTTLEEVVPIDPAQLLDPGVPPAALARASAADEVLLTTVQARGGMGRVLLRRLDGADGRVLWTDAFDIPLAPEGLPLLADEIGVRLRRAYPEHSLRPGTPELDVRDEDYAAFLEIQPRVVSGQPLEPEVARLEEIVRRSPRFLEGHLLAARVYLSLFQSTRKPPHLQRATAFARRARELAPGDPRPPRIDFRIALAAGRPGQAEAALETLRRLSPGDPDLLVLRANLAEHRGNTSEALAAFRTAAERVPSWQNLYELADLEARSGRVADAREHLQALLRLAPDHPWAVGQLARLELFFGDLAEAERIYAGLARTHPQRYVFTNLGLTRFLRGRYGEAVAAYRRALEMEPDHVIATKNLADALAAQGRAREAADLYRRVLGQLDAVEAVSGLPPKEALVKAQCLARLGRGREAAELARRTLRQNPDDAEIAYTASLVHALAGDRSAALAAARLALDRGMQPRWFTVPAFQPWAGDPELRTLLAAGAPR